MRPPPLNDLVLFPERETPQLVVIVDAEEEFQWGDYSRSATSVENIRHQHLAHRIYERYGVAPTYVVDYPVASQPNGFGPLRDLLQDGYCQIGAQLHPWVTPPFEEEVGARTSFACNLHKELEFAKLRNLTAAVQDNFGVRPLVYRAGRYGFGSNTSAALAALGYRVDCSVLPYIDLRPRHGPDFQQVGGTPFWLDEARTLLELPCTVGLVGLLGRLNVAPQLYSLASSLIGTRLRLTAILARSRLLDRIPLTPEGTSIDEAKRMTRWLLDRGLRVFNISYHSSSLVPGHTPYVRTVADRDALLGWIDEYLGFFFGEIGGRAATPDLLWGTATRLFPGAPNCTTADIPQG